MNEPIYIERWITFTLVGDRWDLQLWPPDARPVNARLYKLRVPVPSELIGETINASIVDPVVQN